MIDVVLKTPCLMFLGQVCIILVVCLLPNDRKFSNVENLAFCLTDLFVRSFEDYILTFNLLLEFCIEIYNIKATEYLLF